MSRWAGVGVLLGAVACSEPGGSSAICSFPEDVEAGGGEAVINGEDWAAVDVAWNETGTGLQITTGMSQGWRLTLAIQGEALDSSGLGIVDLDGSGGWGLVYPEDGSSYSSQDGGGSLELVSRSDTVELCLELEAVGADGEVTLEHGYLHAEALELGR